MDLYGDGHKIVTDADHIPGRNYLSGTAPVSVQGQNIVGQTITTCTLTDKSLSNQVVTFNMTITSDTTSGRVFVGSTPNWQVYTYYDVQKGINKVKFTTELNSDVDGIKIALDNSTANLVIQDVTLNKGNFAREYSPAPEDYVMKSDQEPMKSDQEPKVLVRRTDTFSIAGTYQGDLTVYGENTNITDLPSEPNLDSKGTFLVRTFEMPVMGNKFIYQFLLWDGNQGVFFYRATFQDRQGLLQAKWHKISFN